jgi:hypothetical protein
MGVKQFNGTYDKQEDRILFRFNTQDDSEFRFWLTLFITKSLVFAVDELITKSLEKKHNAQIAQVIHEFQDEAIAKSTDLSVSYEGAKSYPLGESPILVTGFSVSENDHVFTFTFRLFGDKSVNLSLPTAATQSMTLLLRKLGSVSHWNLAGDGVLTEQLTLPGEPSQLNKLVH